MDTQFPLADLETAYLSMHEARGSSPQTIARYKETFKLFHRFQEGELSSALLTTETMQAFAIWLRETPTKGQRGSTKRSEVSVHGACKDYRAFIRWLQEEGYLDRVVKVPLPKLPETLFPVLTEADLERIWDSSFLKGNGALCVRNRAMIGLMLDTGLRRAEVAGLTMVDLDLPNCLVTVTGKGNKQRRVPFSHNVKLLLEAWIGKRGDDDDSLFWLKGAGIRTTFRRIEAEIGVKFYSHQVRHTAATALVRNNADPFTVQRILGHADLATTQKYVNQNVADLQAKHAASSPFDSLMGRTTDSLEPARRKRLTRAS